MDEPTVAVPVDDLRWFVGMALDLIEAFPPGFPGDHLALSARGRVADLYGLLPPEPREPQPYIKGVSRWHIAAKWPTARARGVAACGWRYDIAHDADIAEVRASGEPMCQRCMETVTERAS